MIKWTDMTFTGTDVVKLVGFIGGLFTLYFNIVIEIHANKVDYDADKKVMEYRLADLERCCESAVVAPRVALKPDEPKITRRR